MGDLPKHENESAENKGEQNEDCENKEDIDESSPLKPSTETKENEKEKQDVKKKLTFKERLKVIWENTTVEPIMACYIMPSVLASLAVQNLNLDKACRVNLNYSEEICTALNNRQVENYTTQEAEVQSLIANVQGWKTIISTVVPAIIILFVGAWSDKTGNRKAVILIPIVGELLSSIGFIINTYFFHELPVEVTAITEVIFPAFTGGWSTNTIGVFSYIGDITDTENRTYRVGLVNMLMTLGYPIGSALSGVILSWVGYYGVFSISTSLYTFSLLYGYFFLKETKKTSKKGNQTEKRRGFLREFFDLSLVVDTFQVAFKSGPGQRRLRVSLLLVCVFVIFGPQNGEYSIFYLFSRYRFNWDEVQYSMFSSYATVTNMIGTSLSITLFTNYLKLDDTLLALISIASKVVSSFAYAFARNNLEIYLAPLLETLNGTSYIALRAIASKLVDDEEFGKLNSLFGLAESITPLIYGPLYTQVYEATIHVLPGAVFLVGSLLTLPAAGILIWLYFEQKKMASKESSTTDAEKQQTDQLK